MLDIHKYGKSFIKRKERTKMPTFQPVEGIWFRTIAENQLVACHNVSRSLNTIQPVVSNIHVVLYSKSTFWLELDIK